MKIRLITTTFRHSAKAFTLLEMTAVILIGLLIAGMSMVLFNSQLTSFQIIRTQDFLIQEAPQINNTLNQIIPRANFFRLYSDVDSAENNAENGTGSVINGAQVVILEFRNSSEVATTPAPGTTATPPTTYGIIAFDSTTNRLEYYNRDTLASLSLSDPSWTISTRATNVAFFVQQGVLRTTVTGPLGSTVTHSTTTLR